MAFLFDNSFYITYVLLLIPKSQYGSKDHQTFFENHKLKFSHTHLLQICYERYILKTVMYLDAFKKNSCLHIAITQLQF